MTGTDVRAVTGTDLQAVTGTDLRAVAGTDVRAVTGTDLRAVTGTDVRAVTGTDARAVTGTDLLGVTGTDLRAVTGTDLLIFGRVSFLGNDFVSVLGQSVFVDRATISSLHAGSTVAVYGSIDISNGGIVGARIIDAGAAGFGPGAPSFLTGLVDSVDHEKGLAVVSGMTVDYTALLASGSAPSVGDQVSVTGREYGSLGMLVADPNMRLEIR